VLCAVLLCVVCVVLCLHILLVLVYDRLFSTAFMPQICRLLPEIL
jgi:hypothetical protein